MRRPRRGDWVPLLPPRYRWPTVGLLILTPFVAGVDFLLGEEDSAMSIVERSMPAWAWGVLLVIFGGSAVTGYLARWPRLCIAGLYLGGAVFATLSVGVGWGSINSSGGFRGPWLYLVVAATSWLSAFGYSDQLKAEGNARADRPE